MIGDLINTLTACLPLWRGGSEIIFARQPDFGEISLKCNELYWLTTNSCQLLLHLLGFRAILTHPVTRGCLAHGQKYRPPTVRSVN